MKIEMKHEDELLIVPQVAYLLGRSRSSTEKLVTTGVLPEVLGRNRRLIRASDLKDYVEDQLTKYERVTEWEKDKKTYWERSGYRGGKAESEECLTIPQAAFLLQRSRQNIHFLCKKGVLDTTDAPMSRGKEGRARKLVLADSLLSYVQTKTGRLKKALNYFSCDETYYFWQASTQDFEESFLKREREKYKKYAKI